MGPAYLMDVIGIDTINHCYPVMIDGLPQRFSKTAELWPSEAVFKADRLGQKNARGYYSYALNNKGKPSKAIDETVVQMLADTLRRGKAL